MRFLVLLTVCAACGGSPNTGSETHWLAACSSDDECGELSCECGVCTQACATDADCAEMGECSPTGSPLTAMYCDIPPPQALCLAAPPRDAGTADTGLADAAACGPNTCGACTAPLEPNDRCVAGQWECRCVAVDGCRQTTECNAMLSEQCVPPDPDAAPVCGIPMEDECEPVGRPCDQGTCFVGGGACGGNVCAAACSLCDDGDTCLMDGTCEPMACDAGYTCLPHTVCDVGNARANDHGCVRATCADDGECSGGFCVAGACYESLGTCEGPRA